MKTVDVCAYSVPPEYYCRFIDVPLLKRSFELFRSLEKDHAKLLATYGVTMHPPPLLTMTGGIMIGRPDSEVISGTLRSAREHRLKHRLMTAKEVRAAFPAFSLSDDEVAVHEAEAGYLNPEACILAHLRLAEAHGAELHFHEEMISWSAEHGDNDKDAKGSEERLVRVRTAKGEYLCRRLVLSVGPWAPDIYGRDLHIPFSVDRRVLLWLEPHDISAFMVTYLVPHSLMCSRQKMDFQFLFGTSKMKVVSTEACMAFRINRASQAE